MGRVVLLHHVEPGGSHWDLMLERESAAGVDRRLVTFRLEEPVDLPAVAEFSGTRIGDHRAIYLDYEGEVPAPGGAGDWRGGGSGGGRGGRVERVWTGRCEISVDRAEAMDVRVEVGGRVARFTGERLGSGAGTEGEGPGDGGEAWWFTRA